jgi:hypothetical protein
MHFLQRGGHHAGQLRTPQQLLAALRAQVEGIDGLVRRAIRASNAFGAEIKTMNPTVRHTCCVVFCRFPVVTTALWRRLRAWQLQQLHEERLRRAGSLGAGGGAGGGATVTDAKPPAAAPDARTVAREEFDCALCMRLLLEPISLSCGHSFCRQCLVRALGLNPHCPMCRAPTFISPHDQPVNFILSKLIPKVRAVALVASRSSWRLTVGHPVR